MTPGTGADVDHHAVGTADAGGTGGGREDIRASTETVVGVVLVSLTFWGALYLRWRPGPVILDTWVFDLVHPAPGDPTWLRIAELRSVGFLVGSSVLSALVVVSRDRWRAVACLVGPGLAVVLTEYFLKPLIARRYEQVLSFPSGTTTVVASAATAG